MKREMPWTIAAAVQLRGDEDSLIKMDGFSMWLAKSLQVARERKRRSDALLRYYGGGLLARELPR